jgi:hypothetical protein
MKVTEFCRSSSDGAVRVWLTIVAVERLLVVGLAGELPPGLALVEVDIVGL